MKGLIHLVSIFQYLVQLSMLKSQAQASSVETRAATNSMQMQTTTFSRPPFIPLHRPMFDSFPQTPCYPSDLTVTPFMAFSIPGTPFPFTAFAGSIKGVVATLVPPA